MTRIQPGDGDARHGTENGYTNLGCRCDDCKAVWRVGRLRYMQSHPEQRERHRERSARRYASKRVAS